MNIGIIGVGNIGGIFANRLIEKCEALESLYLMDRFPEKLAHISSQSDRVVVVSNAKDVLKNCSYVILSVKPQDSMELFASIKNGIENSPVIISTITGIQINRIAKETGLRKIARIMPNVPSAIGKGVTGFSPSAALSMLELGDIRRILQTMGDIVEVREKDLAAVTALSGSGPAFVFVIVESLIDVGLKMGLSDRKSVV